MFPYAFFNKNYLKGTEENEKSYNKKAKNSGKLFDKGILGLRKDASVFAIIPDLPPGDAVTATGELGTDAAGLAKGSDSLLMHLQYLGCFGHCVNNIKSEFNTWHKNLSRTRRRKSRTEKKSA